jgi:hypothetical protein
METTLHVTQVYKMRKENGNDPTCTIATLQHVNDTMSRLDKYLRIIMSIADKKSTAASSNIMPSPLRIKDNSIKIKGLFFTFLNKQKHLFHVRQRIRPRIETKKIDNDNKMNKRK